MSDVVLGVMNCRLVVAPLIRKLPGGRTLDNFKSNTAFL